MSSSPSKKTKVEIKNQTKAEGGEEISIIITTPPPDTRKETMDGIVREIKRLSAKLEDLAHEVQQTSLRLSLLSDFCESTMCDMHLETES